jgi:hypothetical protein
MHRLRIELGGEGDNLLARHQPRPIDRNRAFPEVFPVECHTPVFTRESG